ncbi:acyl carrier protein [Staphylococcus xylosus]|uniref:acyl carrier protein n=1 Tax=Staphylococcus xylosus TaxID=1288 RepID=UPI003F57691C
MNKNNVEKDIYMIWSKVLEKENISLTESFFNVGGDSLKCAEMHYLITEKYPNSIELIDLFKYTTIEEISDKIIEGNSEEDKGVNFTL